MIEKTYLGDGVYAEFDGYYIQIWGVGEARMKHSICASMILLSIVILIFSMIILTEKSAPIGVSMFLIAISIIMFGFWVGEWENAK